MQPITLTEAEGQLILTLLNSTPITGLANHQVARAVAEKLQAAAQVQDARSPLAEVPSEPDE